MDKEYYLKNKLKLSLSSKLWREKNKDKIKGYKRKYRIKNKEKEIKRQKIWRWKNIEKIRTYRKKYFTNYLKQKPWMKTFAKINTRCNNKKAREYKWYGGKGIKNLLSSKDLEILWMRDNANNMKLPSIDRINSDGNYTLENCRYIERSENSRISAIHRWTKGESTK